MYNLYLIRYTEYNKYLLNSKSISNFVMCLQYGLVLMSKYYHSILIQNPPLGVRGSNYGNRKRTDTIIG